ncbi:MAG: type II toxin-antitoxin system VapB family antitoxin [Acidobacteriia bacterium]|nr:type II toxin-antitoxin system VapB family antitoxin [Terriglobia bacterium]
MKTTINLPDHLLIAAKKLAGKRTTIRALVERGLQKVLEEEGASVQAIHPRIRWVTSRGGLPPGLDLSRPRTNDELAHR